MSKKWVFKGHWFKSGKRDLFVWDSFTFVLHYKENFTSCTVRNKLVYVTNLVSIKLQKSYNWYVNVVRLLHYINKFSIMTIKPEKEWYIIVDV